MQLHARSSGRASTSATASGAHLRVPAPALLAGGRRGAALLRAQASSGRVNLWDACKFNGPAPEVINGRLAMIGFVNGAIYEAQHGETMLQQAASMPLMLAGIMLVWVYASLVPISKGVRNNEAFGPFSPAAEIINGRAAMLGFLLLVFIETKAGVPFF